MNIISRNIATLIFAGIVLFIIDRTMRFIVILLTTYINYDDKGENNGIPKV